MRSDRAHRAHSDWSATCFRVSCTHWFGCPRDPMGASGWRWSLLGSQHLSSCFRIFSSVYWSCFHLPSGRSDKRYTLPTSSHHFAGGQGPFGIGVPIQEKRVPGAQYLASVETIAPYFDDLLLTDLNGAVDQGFSVTNSNVSYFRQLTKRLGEDSRPFIRLPSPELAAFIRMSPGQDIVPHPTTKN